jgi:signal transduction histidine kinase
VLRAIGLFTDVTDRRNAEDQLRRTNEELEQFAYIASHDLKAPLRGIDNLAKWIVEDISDVMTDDAREKMELLRGRVSRLEMLLEDILQYSRAGRIADEPVEIKTGDLIQQIIEDRPPPDGFRIQVPANMPVLVSSHTPLEQVFMNLISNACKHHDRKEGAIKIEAFDRGVFYEFAVEDDGPGIPPQFHDRVFKMFQTLKPRDDKESSGLSIVKKLVEWQGGRVWIVSEPGRRGAAFHFLWPKKSMAVERKKNAA